MNNRTKVIFVMDGMQVGGVENALISVMSYVDFDRYDVDLLLLHNQTALLGEIDSRVHIKKLGDAHDRKYSVQFLWCYVMYKLCVILKAKKTHFWQKRMQYASLRRKAKEVLKKEYDIAIGYKQGESEDFVANCMSAKKKIVFYHHGALIDETLHTQTYPKIDVIVAVSEGVKDLLVNQYPQFAQKIQVISNYVDCQRIYDKSKEYFIDKNFDKINICTVGRLVSEKRYDLVIETAQKMLEYGDGNFVWYCIGEGEERKTIEEYIAEKGLQDHVLLLGEMENPLPYVVSSNVYVQTSDAESYGLAIKEALVLKKPVVSTMTIGGKLLVSHKENGYLSQADPDALYAGIKWCLKSKMVDLDAWNQYIEEDIRIKEMWDSLLNTGG